MKAIDLRKQTVEELKKELNDLLKEQFNLRMQKGAGQAPKAQLPRRVRHDIARIKTVLKEKGLHL